VYRIARDADSGIECVLNFFVFFSFESVSWVQKHNILNDVNTFYVH